MALIITPESELGKELRKWEQHPTRFAIDENGDMTPGNPHEYRPYPRVVYKAIKLEGRITVYWRDPYDGELKIHPQCLKTVHDDSQERVARNEGWTLDPSAAVAALEQLEQERGHAAAAAEYDAQRMSRQAREELAAAHTQTHEHVTDVVPSKKGAVAKEVRDR